jgi:formamidopyrimidine-DNA glycosylase
MPELPEVETIVRNLRQGQAGAPPLPGLRIERVEVHWPRHIATPSPDTFKRRIKRRQIEDVWRRGKYLVLSLDEGTLLIHLKMTGDLSVVPGKTPRGPYDHTVFHLERDWQLRFSDARKFGKLYLVRQPDEVLGDLGPEPLTDSFTVRTLADQLAPRSRAIKPLLLEQGFVAGIGNIYADEALHRAGIHPLTPADGLGQAQIKRLWRSIRRSLEEGIAMNGASLDWVYRGGEYQNHFLVYGRQGEPCPTCGQPIARIVVAQRGTHFCPLCQPRGNHKGSKRTNSDAGNTK